MLKFFRNLTEICKNWEKISYFIENFDKIREIVEKKEVPTKNKRYTLYGVPAYQKKYIQDKILNDSNG